MSLKKSYYFDISKIGKDFTGKKDISIMTDEQAVLESVLNIINTEPSQRIMNPEFGCGINKYMFEPIDIVTASILRKTIYDSITKFESRINNLEVQVLQQEDLNSYIINITFSVKTSNNQQSLTITLNKIR